MKKNCAICLVIWVATLKCSLQIYVPDDNVNLKPVTYTAGIKTSSYRRPVEVQLHHNYSKVYHQNNDFSRSFSDDEETSQRPYPVYNGHTYGQRPPESEKLQVYILNGSRIRKNENPTRQILMYNKQKRTPKVELYNSCPPDTTGQFVYAFSCNQFLNCWKGRGHVQNCAPGTLFNPKTLECDFPNKVECISGPRQTILQGERKARKVEQIGCPKEFSGLIPNYTDCSKFINCVSGIENLMDCPPGTLFDVDKNICDFAHKATCFNGQNQNLIDGRLDFGTTKSTHENLRSNEVRCPYGVEGLHKHPTNCSKFLNCANGQTFVQDCGPGTVFNPILKICDFPYNVRCQIDDGHFDYDETTIQNFGRDQQEQYDRQSGANGGTNSYHTQNGYKQGQQTGYQDSLSSSYGTQYNRGYDGSGSTNQYVQTQYNKGSGSYGTNRESNSGYYSGTSNQRGIYSSSGDQYSQNPSNKGSVIYSSSSNSYRPNPYSQEHPQYTKGSIDRQYHDTYSTSNVDQIGSQYSRGTYDAGQNSWRPDPYIQGSSGTYNQNLYNQRPSEYGANQSGYSRGQTTYTSYDQQPTTGIGRTDQNYHNAPDWTSGQATYPSYSEQPGRRPIGADQNNYNVRGQATYPSYSKQPGRRPSGTDRSSYNLRGQATYPSYSEQPGRRPSGTDQNNYNVRGQTTYPSYNQQPEAGSVTGWRPSSINQNNYNESNWTRGQQTYPSYQNNQNNWGRDRDRTFTSQYEESGLEQDRRGSVSSQGNEWQQGTGGDTGYNRAQSGHNTGRNPLEEDGITSNYDGVVNINQVRKTTRVPFRNSYEPFFGTTSNPRVTLPPSHSNDYDDTFGQGQSRKYARATTPRILEKSWPPPFPSTDVNADYVFEYDDNEEVTLEAENSINRNQKNECRKSDFRCSSQKCISKTLVCNGVKDCPDGKDELQCLEHVSKFSVKKNTKLAILEKERWDNVSIATCALLCVETQKLHCRSFNYRKIDRTCFLTDTNEQLTGALIAYYPFDYYEMVSETINCTKMYVCSNKKCIERSKICDGQDDCGDRMDEKGCKPTDFGYSIRLTGSNRTSEGQIEVTAFDKTGFVCDDNFGLRDADVVCKELGFSLGALEVKGNSFFTKNFTREKPFYMMDDVSCTGNETRLMDCDFSGWGVHNCQGQEIVGIICKTPTEKCAKDYWQCDTAKECLPLGFVCDGLLDCSDGSDEGSQHCDAPTRVRLVGGKSRKEGRVEISHHGIWGTICDDDFNEDAAKVVCKQLGYTGSAVAKKDAHFGPGSGPIWLDQVFCSGNETSIERCSHWNWGEHNCEHGEDVGVICSNTYEYERHSMVTVPTVPQVYPDKCGYRKDNIFDRNDDVHFRVVRGSTARRGDYPWQAAIRVKGKPAATHWCGGVVISEKFILTAAHCLIGYSKGAYIVVAGDYNVDEDEGTEQEAYIEDFYLHENFRQGHKMNNDIALVKLKGRGFRLTGDVQAICLPEANTTYPTGHNCTISGFGSLESGKSAFSHDMRAGWVPLQKREICTMPHVYGDALTDGMICAGSLDEGVDSCDGDSGGPLACLDNGVFTLYGITSWGQHCGHANKPGVYVKVAYYRKWIDETFNKHSN